MGDEVRFIALDVPFRLDFLGGDYQTGDEGDGIAVYVYPDPLRLGALFVATADHFMRYGPNRRCRCCGHLIREGSEGKEVVPDARNAGT